MMRNASSNGRALLVSLVCLYSIVSGGTPRAPGAMRDKTPMEIVNEMKIGWNLGNTLDATSGSGLGSETSWGNPKTTKAMIDALYAKGFRTVRVPVTWNNHFGASPAYAIHDEWLDRVEEVIRYVLDNKMYAILNSHHDDWVTLTVASQTEITGKITKIWAQIAARFKKYGDSLVFETLNEPRLKDTPFEWTGGTAEARSVVNAYNLAIVNTIRASGGNNARRLIMIPTYAASSMSVAQDALVIPNNDSRLIVSQHAYFPYAFSMEIPGTKTWGTASDKAACDAELDRMHAKFVQKGIPVIIGEWGTIHKNNASARAVHAEYYAKAAKKRGMLPVWWDNGDPKENGFALLNRSACTWHFPEIVDGLMKGAQTTVSVSSHDAKSAAAGALQILPGAVRYTVPGPSFVSLRLYDMLGKTVIGGINCYQPAGKYELKLPGKGLPSGTYILAFKTDAAAVTTPVTVNRRP